MNLRNKRTFLITCALGASLALTACTGTKSPADNPTKSPAPALSASPSSNSSAAETSIAKWGSDRAKEIASGGMVAVTAAYEDDTEITADNAASEKVKLVDNISALKIVFDGFKDKLDEEARERYQTELQTLGTGVDRLATSTGADLATHLTDSRAEAVQLMGKLADIEESLKSNDSNSADSSK